MFKPTLLHNVAFYKIGKNRQLYKEKRSFKVELLTTCISQSRHFHLILKSTTCLLSMLYEQKHVNNSTQNSHLNMSFHYIIIFLFELSIYHILPYHYCLTV